MKRFRPNPDDLGGDAWLPDMVEDKGGEFVEFEAARELQTACESALWTLQNLAPFLEEAKRRGYHFGCDPEDTIKELRAALNIK